MRLGQVQLSGKQRYFALKASRVPNDTKQVMLIEICLDDETVDKQYMPSDKNMKPVVAFELHIAAIGDVILHLLNALPFADVIRLFKDHPVYRHIYILMTKFDEANSVLPRKSYED